jgi:hypothetical protein
MDKLQQIIQEVIKKYPGLWANIHTQRERGEKPARKDSKAYKSAVKAGKKINKLNEETTTDLQFPDGFQPAKSVPNGGAMCANCAKWNKEKQLCEGQYYIDWNGNGEIPAEPTEYVCIWWVNEKK